MKISHRSMHEIIGTDQAFIRILQDSFQTSRRRPQIRWLDIWQQLLNCYVNEGYDFVRRTITLNETGLHYHKIEIITPVSMEWEHPQ